MYNKFNLSFCLPEQIYEKLKNLKSAIYNCDNISDTIDCIAKKHRDMSFINFEQNIVTKKYRGCKRIHSSVNVKIETKNYIDYLLKTCKYKSVNSTLEVIIEQIYDYEISSLQEILR